MIWKGLFLYRRLSGKNKSFNIYGLGFVFGSNHYKKGKSKLEFFWMLNNFPTSFL